MPTIDPSKSSITDIYKLLIGSIVPRPIAVVSTLNSKSQGNVAPFSFFNGVSSNPPCLMFSVARKSNGEKKDTLRNIEETKEFVVNSAHQQNLKGIAQTGAEYAYGVNEGEAAGFTFIPSQKVKPPRIKESLIHYECVLHQLVEVGDGSPGSSTIIIGRIVLFHIADEVYNKGKIVLEKLHPIARVGGFGYVAPGTYYEMPIPKVS